MLTKTLLIVDDESVIRHALRRLLKRHNYEIIEAANLEEARQQTDQLFDLALVDVRLPDGAGTDLLKEIHEVPVIIMTSFASIRSAVEAMQLGAFDYVAKPFDHDEMLLTIKRALAASNLKRDNKALRQTVERSFPTQALIGSSETMQTLREQIAKIGPINVPALIYGESGTGKELVARALHQAGPRAASPLVAVNCGAIADGLVEAELFGHEKGAFTGATEKRLGLVQSAHGGTLFLDEVGELPLDAQTQLLRLIENAEVRSVGSARSQLVDIRLIAATHRDLAERVAQGLFRADLYFRLNVVQIDIPPLRERGADLIELVEYIANKRAKELGLVAPIIDDALRQSLLDYDWPGNVRELQNAISRALILADNGEITRENMNLFQGVAAPIVEGDFDLSLDDYFRGFVQHHQHNTTETELAKRLGISRKALWQRRSRMQLRREK